MINDLPIPNIFSLWNYDTTVSEVALKGQQSKGKQAVDHVSWWSGKNLFQINGDKTKELVINSVALNPRSFQQPS